MLVACTLYPCTLDCYTVHATSVSNLDGADRTVSLKSYFKLFSCISKKSRPPGAARTKNWGTNFRGTLLNFVVMWGCNNHVPVLMHLYVFNVGRERLTVTGDGYVYRCSGLQSACSHFQTDKFFSF